MPFTASPPFTTERPPRQYPSAWQEDVWWAQGTSAERRRMLLKKLDATAPLPADHFFNRCAS